MLPPMRHALILLASILLAGCEGWPLYLNLPDPQPPIVEAERIDVTADPDVASGAVQDLGALTPPTVAVISGTVDFCGFDAAAEADWPELPIDLNGDGIADDTAPHHQGWYTGDVDVFGLEAAADGWLYATLQWSDAPEGNNLPVDPSDPEGPWSDETDLDLIVVDWDGDDSRGVLNDQGVSLASPEETGQVLDLAAGERVAVAVACHHGDGGSWSLRLELMIP